MSKIFCRVFAKTIGWDSDGLPARVGDHDMFVRLIEREPVRPLRWKRADNRDHQLDPPPKCSPPYTTRTQCSVWFMISGLHEAEITGTILERVSGVWPSTDISNRARRLKQVSGVRSDWQKIPSRSSMRLVAEQKVELEILGVAGQYRVRVPFQRYLRPATGQASFNHINACRSGDLIEEFAVADT